MELKIVELLEKSRAGDEENAFFGLLEIPGDLTLALIDAFRRESHLPTRALLVKVSWQRRNPSVIPFLGEALRDSQEEVWQEALDGLVTFGSVEALDVLRSAREREFIDEPETKRFRRWLEEAIQQIEETVRS